MLGVARNNEFAAGGIDRWRRGDAKDRSTVKACPAGQDERVAPCPTFHARWRCADLPGSVVSPVALADTELFVVCPGGPGAVMAARVSGVTPGNPIRPGALRVAGSRRASCCAHPPCAADAMIGHLGVGTVWAAVGPGGRCRAPVS